MLHHQLDVYLEQSLLQVLPKGKNKSIFYLPKSEREWGLNVEQTAGHSKQLVSTPPF